MNAQLRIIALMATTTALLLLGGPQAAQAAEPRTVRLYAEFFQTTPSWWRLEAAVRDWDSAPGVRVVLVSHAGPGIITVRDFRESGEGYFERAIWQSFSDGDELWLDLTQARGREPAFRRSVACNGIGLLIRNLPGYQSIGDRTYDPGFGSCMDPEAQYAYPVPVSLTRPSALDLRLAR